MSPPYAIAERAGRSPPRDRPVPARAGPESDTYAELVCRTAFSFHEGTASPEAMVERAADLGLYAVAVTDRDGVYALPRAWRHARALAAEGRPVRLVCGALVTVEGGPGMALLVRDLAGWSNLCRVLTLARCGGELDPEGDGASPHGRPGVVKGRGRVPLAAVLEHAAGLDAILLGDWAPQRVVEVRQVLGEHLSIGLFRRLDSHDSERTAWFRQLSAATGVPLVATGDVLMPDRSHKRLQDVLTCIRLKLTLDEAGGTLQSNAERHLRGPGAMAALFADLPEALARSVEVARRCTFGLDQIAYRYPREIVPEGRTPMSWLGELTEQGLSWRYPQGVPAHVRAQVDHELVLIERLDFPASFLWGTASASWQVEGDFDPDPNDGFDVRSNWTVWTERGCTVDDQTNPEGSGFYTRYADDFALAAGLGNTTYRLGIDWARIEPEEDVWNPAELEHYVDVLQAAADAGLQPMLTLHHWVVPTWIQNPTGDGDQVDALNEDPDGFDGRFVSEFEEFVRYIAPAVAPYVDLYPILNETFSVILGGYMAGGCGSGAFPPGRLLDMASARRVYVNYLWAHAAACRALRELDTVDADGDGNAALCGAAATTNVIRPMDPYDADDVAAAEKLDWFYNHATHVALTEGNVDLDFDREYATTAAEGGIPIDEGYYPELAGTIDWIGINYYGPIRITGTGGGSLGGVPSINYADYDPDLPHSELGFAIDPSGLGEILTAFSTYGLPMYLTENGIGDSEDDDRPRYLVEHLEQIARSMNEGIDVRGYYHWSLTDNFEWAEGFNQRFGLFRVDYDDPDRTRTPGRSVDAYRAIIAASEVTPAIRQEYASSPYPTDGRQ